MTGTVLILGADERLAAALAALLPGLRVRQAQSAVDTEGLGVDVVVIAGQHPFDELTEVRVHPELCSTPVALVAPGHQVAAREWQSDDVWCITTQGFDLVDDLADQIRLLLARTHHPSNIGRATSVTRSA